MSNKIRTIKLATKYCTDIKFIDVASVDELLAHPIFVDIKNSVGFVQFAKYKTYIYKEFFVDNVLYYEEAANTQIYQNKTFLKSLPNLDPTAKNTFYLNVKDTPVVEPKPPETPRLKVIHELQEEIDQVSKNYRELDIRVRKMRRLIYKLNTTLSYLLKQESQI